MIEILINDKWEAVTDAIDLNIVYDYDGFQTLSFDILINTKFYKHFSEEIPLKYNDNYFLIKKINQRKTLSTITANLDMTDWKTRIHQKFHTEYKLFSEVMLLVAPTGWTIEDDGSVVGRRAMTLEGVTDYDVLMHCKKLYNIVYEFHITDKKIKAVKPDIFQSRGLYITDELNLKDLTFKGDSSNFATRLYAYGKKEETRDTEGNVISVKYVTFADINDGKEYIDNNAYSDKVISAYWQDDRYLNAEELLNDAIDKLKTLALPERAYSCTLIDLSRTNDKYKYLDFKLYDKVTLIDNVSKIHIQHQIVQYIDYPYNPNKNKVMISSTFKSVVGTVDGLKKDISNIDIGIKRTETSINEIIRDVESNTLRINNTYTVGETNIVIENIIQQAAGEFNISISEVKNSVETTKSRVDDLSITVEGLTNRLITTGGNNMVRDSAGLFNDGSWIGNYNLDASMEVKNRNEYGTALLLKNGSLKQNIRLGNGKYTLSFIYRKHIALSNVKVMVDGDEVLLNSDEYTLFTKTYTVDDTSFDIEFLSDTDNACTIINLMLNKGSDMQIWSLNSNENYSDTVKMGRGIEIGAAGIPSKFIAKADIIGFKNVSTGEFITVFTDVGMDAKEVVIRRKANIVNLLIQSINGQTVITKLEEG